MRFQFLELLVGAQVWILVVQANHHANVQEIRLHVVYEGAAVAPLVERPSNCVADKTRLVVLLLDLPDFLNTQSIVLWADSLSQVEFLHQLFRNGAASPFGHNRLLAQKLHAWFETVLDRSILCDANILQLHTDNCTVLVKDSLVSGKTRVDFDA